MNLTADDDAGSNGPAGKDVQQIILSKSNTALCAVPGFAPDMQKDGAAFTRDRVWPVVIQDAKSVIQWVRTAQGLKTKRMANGPESVIVVRVIWIVGPDIVQRYRSSNEFRAVKLQSVRPKSTSNKMEATSRSNAVAFATLNAYSAATN